MNRQLVFLSSLLFLIMISGCTVLSFYPLYTEDTLRRDDRIIGTWETINEDDVFFKPEVWIWEISFQPEKWKKKINNPFDRGERKIPNQHTYTVFLYPKTEPERKAEFRLHLVELEGQFYMDLYPENLDGINDFFAMHLLPVHTIAKVSIGETLNINWFDFEWLEKLFEENRIRIHHERNKNNILLTAKPEELQKFVIKYANEKEAFEDGLHYTLKRIN